MERQLSDEKNGEISMEKDSSGATSPGRLESKKPTRTKTGVIIGVVALAFVVFAICIYKFVVVPHNQAVDAFNAAAAQVEEKNAELQSKIDTAQSYIDSGDKPLDVSTQDALTLAVADARQSLREVPDLPSSTDEINAAADELGKPLDYSSQAKALDDAAAAFETSVQQLKQITAPSQDFVVSRLGQVKGISDIEAVSEDNDPNGLLNKQGGYTAAIYFHYDVLPDSYSIYAGKTSIENGNDGGGCVEVYPDEETANKRNDYLSAFDGAGFLSPGGHVVYGSCLIRTSNEITATQQNELTSSIQSALTAIQ